MNPPTVSVALCTYNGERFLTQQLASIAGQDRSPNELVACDDGSTDETLAQLESFALSAAFPVRIVRNARNLGSNANFEQAIGLCGGDFIFLSDQDDVWRPEKVSATLAWFDAYPDAEAVFSDGEVIDERSRPTGRTLWQAVGFDEAVQKLARRVGWHRLLENRCCATGAAMALRRRLLARILPLPTRLPVTVYHDAWIARVASVAGTLDSLPQKLIGYREHPAQQIGFRPETAHPGPPLTRREHLVRNHRQAEAIYQELKARCAGHEDRLAGYRRAAEHHRHRCGLPGSRLARLPLIARELWRGGYGGRGLSALKQVLGDATL